MEENLEEEEKEEEIKKIEEEKIRKARDAVKAGEEVEEVYHAGMGEEENTEGNPEEEGKGEKTDTQKEKEGMDAGKGGDKEEKKEFGESAKPRELVYTKVKGNQRLVKTYTGKKREGEENRLSRPNLEDGRTWPEWDIGLTEYVLRNRHDKPYQYQGAQHQ